MTKQENEIPLYRTITTSCFSTLIVVRFRNLLRGAEVTWVCASRESAEENLRLISSDSNLELIEVVDALVR